ncbi:hypothetical protein [Amycolatopsis sp. FDAARGOS 1241]|uniref:hypothetical protein n=1 Tax=Amycolatopsis sp. FDAARGOS 1241 TaxID=2778070 RepID=UPI00194E0164|nr:hypothetical protein [Amycolatopsis sp. FDAARGOS 1241]QRP45984.1 hypothetical protein I6J71_44170 [Amycolatopsis sp. FDAARGOS 1241]
MNAKARRLRGLAAELGCSPDDLRRLLDQGLLLLALPWRLTEPRHVTEWGISRWPRRPVARTAAGSRTRCSPLRGRLRRALAKSDRVRAGWLDGLGLVHETVAHGPERKPRRPRGSPVSSAGSTACCARPSAGYFDLVRVLLAPLRKRWCRRPGGVRVPRDLDPMRSLPRCAVPDPQVRDVAGASVGRPAHSVFWQVASDVLVVNQVHPGYLGAVARWPACPGWPTASKRR